MSALSFLVTKLWLHCAYAFQICDLCPTLCKDSTNIFKSLVAYLHMPLIALSNLSSLCHFSFPSKQRRAGITTYGSPAPFSVVPSLMLLSNTCKVWSRGVNNIISEILEWKSAPLLPMSQIFTDMHMVGWNGRV